MKILNPTMRYLGAEDVSRAAAFYRDVLAFEIAAPDGVTEAVHGPARLQFGTEDYSPDDWNGPRPRGSCQLFFEVDDIDAAHAGVMSRGGRPGEIAKVNWIKMRMFEVRDPDGHAVWFGQSYQMPDAQEAVRPMCEKALPAMPFDDVEAAVAHYRDVLGFKINYAQPDLGVMDRDRITVLLVRRDERHTGIGSFEVYIANADELHAELVAKGAKVLGPPVSRAWGLRDFTIEDCEGNRIVFAQPFE